MYQRKLMKKQIETCGVRIGDSCSITPCQGRKKDFTLNRNCIDLISNRYRPDNLSFNFVELPNTEAGQFHYRLELETMNTEPRYVLKTLKGSPFWLNGALAREAYIERLDRLFIDDNKLNFNPFDLEEVVSRKFDHPILVQQELLSSELKILIQGETGTGKTYLAGKIHEKSGRPGSFVSINLSSLNTNLIESELFGHRKGSFTGALKDKKGAFEVSEFGTLFLDEVDSLPMDLQIKLLTFLDNNKFRPVGDTKEIAIKTRLIFASGRPMEKLVQQGLIRKDFYYRLKSGHTVDLPSLRSDVRKIRETCQQFSIKSGVNFTSRVTEFYETLAWPGNLRQLLGHLEKKKILSKSAKLDFDYLDEELLLQSSDLMSLNDSFDLIPMQEMKCEYAKKVLAKCEGSVALASKKLQINEKTFKGLIQKEYEIVSSQERM